MINFWMDIPRLDIYTKRWGSALVIYMHAKPREDWFSFLPNNYISINFDNVRINIEFLVKGFVI